MIYLTHNINYLFQYYTKQIINSELYKSLINKYLINTNLRVIKVVTVLNT